MRASLQKILGWMGRAGIAFLAFLLLFLALDYFMPLSGLKFLAAVGVFVTGVWLAVRLLRTAVWRLRNRLIVTYMFIAVVPIVLIAALASMGGYLLISQLAVYLVTSELDRRIDSLDTAAESIVRTAPADRTAVMRRMTELFYSEHNPGLEILVREGGNLSRYPDNGTLPAPRREWKEARGVLVRDGKLYAWSHRRTGTGDVTVTAPLTGDFLAGLVPNLGVVDFLESRGGPAIRASIKHSLPPPMNRFDREVHWFATIPAAVWEEPGKEAEGPIIAVHSRISAVLAAVFDRQTDPAQQVFQWALIGVAIVFLLVEIVSMIIGVSMTRTITGAVHRLYEGTQKVMEGNFSHRIEVKGKDQLASLSESFNRMTENLEQLLVVAKEKERLQSEVEIAREVQSQLYPRVVPQTRTLRLTAVCHPARMCSGDYYDYEVIRDSQVALAIGDVAGKGISAALLMATLQSSLRSQLQSALEIAAAAGNGSGGSSLAPFLSTSHLVSRLNNQLHAYTSPEKYATFCFGIFDEPTGIFTYTNAGHLPPLLVRNGVAERLDVNGTVVGAFPFAKYDESHVELKSSDLLVCYTDGITEPENEYGEMFGEDRLIELIARSSHLNDEQIIEVVLESVREWTATDELQDDMTVLLARRV
ncbi:MAG TPA: SpoIIE family protein phosphatase [Bryobacteraceae bacterium]|nr:SpoIIE family protein phosphatase [Bryobacteraceae bacterium]